ncbi:MAG TPA: glycosyltransferase family 9 protein, partial [Candidatus Paceibacterota bacterium]
GPKILIVGVNWLGDVLFLTPAIRALKAHFPEACFACAVPARCAGLLQNNPYLSEVIEWDDKIFLWTPFKFFSTLRRIKKRRFNSVIFFHRSKTKAFMAWLAGIRRRAGYEAPFQDLHRTDHFLNLIKKMGVPPAGRTPDFFIKKGTEEELRGLLLEKGVALGEPYIVVHAGGNWELKRWPADYFVEWIRLFLERYSMKVVLCGTASERKIAEQIISHFKNGRVVSLCGETSLDGLAALLKNAKLLLSNDSGPIHLAASQKTKIVGVFGPTSAKETGPISEAPVRILRKDVGCQIPCYFRSCHPRVCMEWLKPEEVFAQTAEILS